MLEVKKILDKFGKRLVQASRSSLTQKKVKASGELYKSISYDLKVSPNSFEFSFGSGLDYANFQDQGVSGTEKKFNTQLYVLKRIYNRLSISDGISLLGEGAIQKVERKENNLIGWSLTLQVEVADDVMRFC